MPKPDDMPRALRPYLAHGVHLESPDARGNWRGACPFCGRDGKLSVSEETGSAHCWACTINPDAPKGGVNLTSFLRLLWERSAAGTTADDLEGLREDRGCESAAVLAAWGACRSCVTGEWLVPGRDAALRVCQLYRWRDAGGGKRTLMATPKAGDVPGGGLFLDAGAWDPEADAVHLCEGPWDGAALDEALRDHKWGDLGEVLRTGEPSGSLRAGANVAAVPGTGAVGDLLRAWLPLFRGKRVTLWFDADDAGAQAARRAAGILAEVARSVSAAFWPGGLPAGVKDVRDALVKGGL